MSKLNLSIAVGEYDRVRPLKDGDVPIDGVDPVFLSLDPEEIFFRAFGTADFDICELSFSSYVVKTAAGTSPYVGVPVFPSRAFRHTSIYVNRNKGITKAQDLRGKRIGVPEYQLTANVWARAFLHEDYGIAPAEIEWVRGGVEEAGRREKIALNLPADIRISDAPEDATLSQMLDRGEIDALIGPRLPSCMHPGGHVGWLFDDPVAAATDYFKRTGIFPIMHLLGIRRSLVEAHPWLPATVLKAFEASRKLCMARLSNTAATKVSLPFVEEQLAAARALMGDDYWSYGFARNHHVVQAFLKHHHAQGLSERLLQPEELFYPATLDTVRI